MGGKKSKQKVCFLSDLLKKNIADEGSQQRTCTEREKQNSERRYAAVRWDALEVLLCWEESIIYMAFLEFKYMLR